MKPKLYRTGAFARKASVSLRTLRYYDSVGLLSPACRTEAGYRLYSEEDLFTLQHILALKYLGFALEEIRQIVRQKPDQLGEALQQQKRMLLDKRRQLDAILKAIENAASLLQSGRCDWQAIVEIIKEIQMEQTKEWATKYFRGDQLEKLEQLSAESYSPEARQKLAARGEWTEQEQERVNEAWAYVAAEMKRLAEIGADPAGVQGQALAKFKGDLLRSFTQGDPDIEAGLKTFWEKHSALPEGEQPLTPFLPPTDEAGDRFMKAAEEVYHARKQAG